MTKFTVLTLVIAATFCDTVKLPSSFKKCKKSQNDFNGCLTIAVIDAIQQLTQPKNELGLPNMEPLEVPSLVIGAGTGPVQFAQNYKDMKVIGLTKMKPIDVSMDLEKKKLKLHFNYPEITILFNYDINGKILVLPITGNGPGSIKMRNVDAELTFFLEEYEKKSKKHFKVTKKTLSLRPQNIRFQLDNLFNGDKVLGDNINQVMNDNYAEIYADVQSSYEDAFGQIFASIFENLLERVPIADLFDE